MEHDFDRLKCFVCSRYYMDKDRVFIDELNTVIHQECYHPDKILTPKNSGTYREMMERYDFFAELQVQIF